MIPKKVKIFFKKYNIEDRIIELKQTSATVKDAAIALSCLEDEIAKSLAFNLNDDNIIIVVSGSSKIDNAKYRKEFNCKAKMINYSELKDKIGHPAGGVCPFAINEGVKVYLDVSLKKHKFVYPACGTDDSAIKLSILELEECSSYIKWVDVCKLKDNML